MAAPLNVNATSVAAMIKELFPQRRIDRLWQLKYPLLAEIKKSDRFEGSSIRVPVEVDHPAVSSSFARAQDNRYATASEVFDLTRASLYGIGRVDAETMRSTRSNKGGFLRVLDREISNVLLAMQKRVALGLYRSSNGWLGVVSSVATAVYTLTNKSDVFNFSVGAEVVMADGADGGTPRDSGTAKDITAIDFTNGTITLSAAITGGVAGDYIFIEGDDATAYSGFMAGFEDWFGSTAALFGVTRTGQPERLSGHRITDTSLSLEEALQEAAYRISYTGMGLTSKLRAYASPIQVKQLAMELDSKVMRDPGGVGMVGFSGVNVATAAGMISVMADPACAEDTVWVGDLDALELIHLDPLPHMVQDEGLKMLRVSDADEVEFRARLWGNLACTAPGRWCKISRSTVF